MEYGLIGEKLAHSHSPAIHSQLGTYDYILKSLPPDELASFINAREFKGLNVTIPYKQSVMPLCDSISDSAMRIGSVNTLVIESDGRLVGYNTDYYGFWYASQLSGISYSGRKVLVLGSGGTSHTVQTAVLDSGASEVVVVSRTGTTNYENVWEHQDAEVIVNTTPVGMYPNNGARPIDLSRFPSLKCVFDVIYNPLETALLRQARELGLTRCNGLPMLVAQAKASAELFTEKYIEDREIPRITNELAKDLTNVVLVGMPGSGKTTIGKALAALMGREFIDNDDIIAQKSGMPVPQIIKTYGEVHFRRLESEALREICSGSGRVIATGGGAVLKDENRDVMQQNSLVYHIRRPLSELATDGRPLSSSLEALKEMESLRLPIYSSCSNAEIQNCGTIEDAAKKILENFYEHFNH